MIQSRLSELETPCTTANIVIGFYEVAFVSLLLNHPHFSAQIIGKRNLVSVRELVCYKIVASFERKREYVNEYIPSVQNQVLPKILEHVDNGTEGKQCKYLVRSKTNI